MASRSACSTPAPISTPTIRTSTVPARCTILHAIQVPLGRNGTTFANQTRAYADLADAMKARIDSLVGRHHYGNRDDLDEKSRTVASVLSEDQKKKVHWVRHRIARAASAHRA